MFRILFLVVFAVLDLTSFRVKSDSILNYLGTRTPYRFRYNENESEPRFPGCEDFKIWMITRHGTRLPSPKDIIGMQNKLKSLKNEIIIRNKFEGGPLNDEQIEEFFNWDIYVQLENSKILASEGEHEMTLLSKRMQKRFPNAIKNKYDNETFSIRYTATQRTKESAKYFIYGLFNKNSSANVYYQPPLKVDPVLRFYKHCDRWLKQVKKNENTYFEQRSYGLSHEMNKTLNAMSKRLGLINVLNVDDGNLIYKACGFETAWTKAFLSPWCHAFDVNDAQVFEYYADLQHYWLDGYGHELTYRQACLTIKSMIEQMSSDEPPNATFFFAHSGTMLKLISHLHLFKPKQHLRADFRDPDRPWKCSLIDCFASNLAFVLYKCEEEDKILTLYQEKIIKLPMCDEELCPLKTIKEYLFDSIYNCDYTDMCRLDERTEL